MILQLDSSGYSREGRKWQCTSLEATNYLIPVSLNYCYHLQISARYEPSVPATCCRAACVELQAAARTTTNCSAEMQEGNSSEGWALGGGRKKKKVGSLWVVLEGGQCQRRWVSRNSAGDQVKAHYKRMDQTTRCSSSARCLWSVPILKHFLAALRGKAKAECWLLQSWEVYTAALNSITGLCEGVCVLWEVSVVRCM